MTSRSKSKLTQLKQQLIEDNPKASGHLLTQVVDIADSQSRAQLVTFLEALPIDINLLINNAGINQFKLLEQLTDEEIEQIIYTNTLAPIMLTKALLPMLKRQKRAQIVNIGSTYGSIGFPGYTPYCASKFALRGFSQTLARELLDTKVSVKYLSPRATKTELNSPQVENLNQALNSNIDSPHLVAKELVQLIQSNNSERFIGWPEKLFVKVNNLLPSVVTKSIGKQLPVIKRFATEQAN